MKREAEVGNFAYVEVEELDADIDNFCVPIRTEELDLFPAICLISLCNSQRFMRAIKNRGLVTIGEFGWRLYARLTEEQKCLICSNLCNMGITVIPHDSPEILSKHQLTIGLYCLCKALKDANVTTVYIGAYGMKMPYEHISFLGKLTVVYD